MPLQADTHPPREGSQEPTTNKPRVDTHTHTHTHTHTSNLVARNTSQSRISRRQVCDQCEAVLLDRGNVSSVCVHCLCCWRCSAFSHLLHVLFGNVSFPCSFPQAESTWHTTLHCLTFGLSVGLCGCRNCMGILPSADMFLLWRWGLSLQPLRGGDCPLRRSKATGIVRNIHVVTLPNQVTGQVQPTEY